MNRPRRISGFRIEVLRELNKLYVAETTEVGLGRLPKGRLDELGDQYHHAAGAISKVFVELGKMRRGEPASNRSWSTKLSEVDRRYILDLPDPDAVTPPPQPPQPPEPEPTPINGRFPIIEWDDDARSYVAPSSRQLLEELVHIGRSAICILEEIRDRQ